MKTKINQLFLFALFALLSFTACQDEVTEVTNPNEQETIVPNSTLAGLISSTAANFGAVDDLLDGASCFSVQLPVSIIVSDVTIVIETLADLAQLEDLFENLDDDEDLLDFVFPITIIFSDYMPLVIINEDQLEDYINQCDNEVDDIIECVDFVYPISFSVFNSVFNIIDTVVIQSDEALYTFLEDLEDDENALIVSLNYTVTLEYANGETIEVNTNQELADAIEAADDDCEDDEDDNCLEEEVALNLVECPWEVFLYSNDDLENLSGPYLFNFNADGTMVIEGVLQDPYTTTWELLETDIGLELNIASFYYFEDEFGTWLVIECDDDDIEFEHLTVEGTGLFFEQECEDDLDCSITDISDILQECPWDFSDGTGNFDNYQMVFNENGELLIPEGMAGSAIGGAWSLSVTDNGLILTLSELTAFQDSLGGDWLIVECDDDNDDDHEITIIRGNAVIELEQDCDLENDEEVFDCFDDFELVACANPNGEAEFNLSANTIGLIICPESFIASFHVTLANAETNTEAISNTESYFSIAGQVYLRIEAESGNFEIFTIILNTEECSNFDCFVDTEISSCSENNDGIATFNLTEANQECGPDIAIYGIYYFESESDAQNNVNPIANPDNYTNTVNSTTLFGAVVNVNGNVVEHIFTITLIPENCNLFECFQSFDALLEVCDNGTDGPYEFNLEIVFDNCEADDITYYTSAPDAVSGLNPIANPSSYNTADISSTIYAKVEINELFEIFPVQLTVLDCNQDSCTEEEVDAFLVECVWSVASYNGGDTLLGFNFDFEDSNQNVAIFTDLISIDATWSTSQSSEGVIVEFSNVIGPIIQIINGEWLVVDCEADRLELHRGDDILVLERNCE